MAAERITTLRLINLLRRFNRSYFTSADLQKITGLGRPSLAVALSRLTKRGVLVRLKRGIYQLSLAEVTVPRIASQLYFPSYLSFESALSRYGILSQIPYTQTFATTKRSKKMIIQETEVEFRQLKPELFFGYIIENGLYIAEPEKALLDQLYMVSRGKGNLALEELDLREIDATRFEEYAKKFPAYTKSLIDEVKKYIGATPLTTEDYEHIRWK